MEGRPDSVCTGLQYTTIYPSIYWCSGVFLTLFTYNICKVNCKYCTLVLQNTAK